MPTRSLSQLLRQLDAWQAYPSAMLVYVDIRQMREINLWSEPGTGDRIIAQAQAVLRDWAGPDALAMRLWSNEFIAAKAIDHVSSAIEEAQALRDRLCAIRYDSLLGDSAISLSMGLATTRGRPDWRALFTQVSEACSQAKRRGLNQIVSVNPQRGTEPQNLRDAAAVRQFRELRAQNRLTLHLQPVMNIRDSTPRLAKAEFLLRMEDEHGTARSLPPGTIEAMEHFGLATELDRFTAQFVLAWIDANRSAIERLDGLTMNLSAKSIADARFMAELYSDVRALQAPPGKLGFEITETAAVEHLELAAELIGDFQMIGSPFSLDDFGSGLCSFGYLHSLPVSEVKIDGRFIRALASQPISQEIVRAIAQVARAAGKRTVAEFVDAQEKLVMLRELQIDYAQGFLFSPAMPPEQLLELIAPIPA